MEIKISVIIPVYNMEKYLQECLDTVANQTLREIEIICVNDGSTDNSEKIISQNVEKDSRIILINKENGGAASARNKALEVARGEFVIFMDPDDWYPEKDILEVLYTKAKENDVLICGGSFSEISEEKGLVVEFTGPKAKYAFAEDGLIYYKDYQFDYGYHRFIYNLEFLRKHDIIFPPYLRYQDPPFFVKAMIKAEKFYAVKKIVYRYRVGHQNVQWTERKLTDLLKGLKDNIEMSGEAGLSQLHKLTVERLGRVYRDMYASAIGDNSLAFLRLLIEVDSVINPELIVLEKYGDTYIETIPKIIKRAIEIERTKNLEEIERLEKANKKLKKEIKKLKNDDWKKKYDGISKSVSFKIGRIITYIPRKIVGLFKKK